MLPNNNQLDYELIEQVGGGSSDLPELDEPASCKTASISDILAVCLENQDTYERTNELCRNCEPNPIPKIDPVDDIKTTIPDLPKKNKLVKIH